MNITKFLGVVTVVVILYSVEARAQIGEVQEVMGCVEKLMPCQPYINSDIPPPPWCCDPMKEIAEKNLTCLCAVFNHPDMLSYINLTKDNALNLLRSCGANHDESLCSNTSLSSPTSSTGSTTSGSSSASTTKNAALAISFLGLSSIYAFRGF